MTCDHCKAAVNSEIAGAAMGFSSVSVVANTLRPRRFRARHTGATTAPASAPTREAITA